MGEFESMKNYNAIPILKVCPGKLTKNFRNEPNTYTEECFIIRKSFLTSTLPERVKSVQINAKSSAFFEIGIRNLKFTKVGCDFLLKSGTISLTWEFMEFPESNISAASPNLSEDEITFDISVSYKIFDTESLMSYLEGQKLKLHLVFVMNDVHMRLGAGELSMSRAVSSPKSRITDEVPIYYSSENDDKNILLGMINLWYYLDFNRKTVLDFNKFYDFPKVENPNLLLTPITAEQVMKIAPSVSSKSDLEITESELKQFQESLFLVLNRNKALRISQAEISKELRDRAEWLKEEAMWRRTLQEYAILSGKNPHDVQWRQWRDNRTSQVMLRSFPSTTANFDPILKITICHVVFYPKTPPYEDEKIQQIYVEYSFLNKDGAEMEYEVSIPKPPPGEPAIFDFEKSYSINVEEDRENCFLLSTMIRDRVPLKISVVSEPVLTLENLLQTCTEIGFAEVDLFDLVQLESNCDENEYPLHDPKTYSIIGNVKMKIEGILAARKMALLVLAPKNYSIIA